MTITGSNVNAGDAVETVFAVLSTLIGRPLGMEMMFDMSLCTQFGGKGRGSVELRIVEAACGLHSSSGSKGDRSTSEQVGAR